MAERVRWAVVGAGGAAQVHHLPVLREIDSIELVGVCDTVAERAEALAAAYGVPAYVDVGTMLLKEKPDVLDVCTGEPWHYEPALKGLEAGAHVIVEKPMVDTVQKGRDLVEAAERAGRLLAVDYNYRFIPAFQRIKLAIDSGELGELAYLQAHVASYCFHHTIDLMRYWGGEVEALSAMYHDESTPYRYKLGDWIYCPSRNESVTLRFTSGALGVITGSVHVPVQRNLVHVHCVGSRGEIMVDGISIHDVVGRVVLPGGESFVPGTESDRAQGFNLCFKARLAAFAQAVLGNGPATPDGRDGLRALEIEEAVVASRRTGQFVPLLVLA